MTAPTLTVRELGPHDGAVLDAVFAGLSTLSRFTRFHGAVPRMSAPMRAQLAAVDGRRHMALGAFVGPEPVGIARLIAVGPGRADLAVEVVDAWQGNGIGARLVREVVALGRERGITEVVAEVLAENAAMRRVLALTFPELLVTSAGPEITYIGRASQRSSERRSWPAAETAA
ncbi:MAG TPA: GNAT family N-acetyltransferase [Pseudonocardia sp.]|jgi:GNAT superfamily N-acetyltransferase|nr:GNAT family N-acetyltransferase [Pseudonocardia sp.]